MFNLINLILCYLFIMDTLKLILRTNLDIFSI